MREKRLLNQYSSYGSKMSSGKSWKERKKNKKYFFIHKIRYRFGFGPSIYGH